MPARGTTAPLSIFPRASREIPAARQAVPASVGGRVATARRSRLCIRRSRFLPSLTPSTKISLFLRMPERYFSCSQRHPPLLVGCQRRYDSRSGRICPQAAGAPGAWPLPCCESTTGSAKDSRMQATAAGIRAVRLLCPLTKYVPTPSRTQGLGGGISHRRWSHGSSVTALFNASNASHDHRGVGSYSCRTLPVAFRVASVGNAEITDRSKRFTDSDVSNTAATSGSRTTATVVPLIRDANRFGRLCA